jgi:hypothetical protein
MKEDKKVKIKGGPIPKKETWGKKKRKDIDVPKENVLGFDGSGRHQVLRAHMCEKIKHESDWTIDL